MVETQPKKIIIPKGTLDPTEHNVIEVPEGCEDSRILIAKLQAKFSRPAGYYPPPTNPEYKFPRTVYDKVVALGVPPLSPIQEERRDYVPSLYQYGKHRKVYGVSCDPSYFGENTTHGSRTISGKFDYCPTSTPIAERAEAATTFPSSRLSPIVMGRDIFAPDPSVYRSATTPPSIPPPRPTSRQVCSRGSDRSNGASFESPGQSRPPQPSRLAIPRKLVFDPASSGSCSIGDVSDMLSFDQSRGRSMSPPPRRPQRTLSPPRPHVPSRPVPPRHLDSLDDKSCSLGDLSEMVSFDASRRSRPEYMMTPPSIKGMSQLGAISPGTPISDDLNFSVVNESMLELESIEVEELINLQEKMRSFQDARRKLVVSILTLSEPECA